LLILLLACAEIWLFGAGVVIYVMCIHSFNFPFCPHPIPSPDSGEGLPHLMRGRESEPVPQLILAGGSFVFLIPCFPLAFVRGISPVPAGTGSTFHVPKIVY
jgi:hypothetical protein